MSKQLSFSIKSKIENIYRVESRILDLAENTGFDTDARFSLRLAMDEALINAITHGNGGEENKEIWVQADCDEEKISVTVRDQGNGFDQHKLHDPRQEPFLHSANGRGVFLIRQFTHQVRFNEKGNEITFSIWRNQPIAVLKAC